MGKSNRSTAQATRERILFCAKELFEERRFDDVTLKDIAAAAGVTMGAIAHYWPSKAALQSEVMTMSARTMS